jgi:hypothetical protein
MRVTLPVYDGQFECKKYFDTNIVDNKRKEKEKEKKNGEMQRQRNDKKENKTKS